MPPDTEQSEPTILHADGVWEMPLAVDIPEHTNIPAQVFRRARKRPHDIVVERRTGVGVWQRITATEFTSEITSLALGLHGFGIKRGDRVAILAPTSYEWAVLDHAILALGAIVVPIYESDSATQIKHILADAKVALVVTQTIHQEEMVRSVKGRATKTVLSIDGGGLRTIRNRGSAIPEQIVTEGLAETGLDDTATIIYTSGTTGMPKGVVLTHGNFVRALMQAYGILPDLIANPKTRALLFLPVAHVLARFVMHGVLMGKAQISFSPDTRTLLQDIEEFRPTAILVVPRVLEKVYNSAAAKAGTGMRKRFFGWSAQQSRKMSAATAYPKAPHYEPANPGAEGSEPTGAASTGESSPGPSRSLRFTHRVADRLVLGKVRQVLGPTMDMVICGGAPLPVDLAHFFRGLGVELLQGYGLSETTGPITVERPGDNPPASVGYLWPGNSMKLSADGELLLKGISVSPGYFNLPKETAAAFKDGWFHTGDLARIDEVGRVYITGRKKEMLVTAGGKNVSPEVLEYSLASHPLIEHVLVVGDNRPFIGALVTLDGEMLGTWLENHNLPRVPAHEAATLPEVKQSITRAIARANENVSRAESIRRFRILDREFTVENGYLTPSLKLKRRKVLHDFAAEVDRLYELSPEELIGTGGTVAPPKES